MTLALLHRRLAVGMGTAGLAAFAVGVGLEAVSPFLAAVALSVAFFWRPTPETSEKLERLWLPLAFLLVLRSLYHVVAIRGDVVIPVVDLLLLLLCAEALRSLDAVNDVRLYALSFALLLASTAYRPGIVFGLAFVTYVILATLALMVGHLRRRALRFGVRDVPVGRPVLATTVALAGVTLASSLLVFLTFPRVSQGWSGRGETLATSVAGFSDEVSLGEFGASIYPNPEIVLRVEFPDGLPADYPGLHWRGRSFDRFDGVRWTRSSRLRPSSGGRGIYERSWSRPRLRQKIFGAPLESRVLFGVHPMVDVDPHSPIHPLMDMVGDFVYWGSGAPSYTATSLAGRPTAEELRQAESGFMPDRDHYLQLPRLPDRVAALADSVTAGLETRYDQAARIEAWLQTSFAYTLELPATAREATLEHFLFERRAGHCEYFSTAMVVLLRSQGIHARNVNGFLGGNWNDFGEYLAVTQNEAHSWVEVWFPGYGWVPFDPTPGGGSGGGSTAWFWPGRFLWDGVQHRWSKWVLDYSLQNQSDVLGGLMALLGGSTEDEARGADGGAGEGSMRPFVLAAAFAALFVALLVAGLRRRRPPETRAYLRLLDACRRRGVVRGEVAPLELVERVRSASARAAVPAAAVVGAYVRARFAGQVLDERDRKGVRVSLRDALRELRRAGAV